MSLDRLLKCGVKVTFTHEAGTIRAYILNYSGKYIGSGMGKTTHTALTDAIADCVRMTASGR